MALRSWGIRVSSPRGLQTSLIARKPSCRVASLKSDVKANALNSIEVNNDVSDSQDLLGEFQLGHDLRSMTPQLHS